MGSQAIKIWLCLSDFLAWTIKQLGVSPPKSLTIIKNSKGDLFTFSPESLVQSGSYSCTSPPAPYGRGADRRLLCTRCTTAVRTRADRRSREEGDRPDQREATRVPWLVAGYRGGREGGWVRGGLRLSGEKVNKSPWKSGNKNLALPGLTSWLGQ